MLHFTFYLELIAQYSIMFPNNKHMVKQTHMTPTSFWNSFLKDIVSTPWAIRQTIALDCYGSTRTTSETLNSYA